MNSLKVILGPKRNAAGPGDSTTDEFRGTFCSKKHLPTLVSASSNICLCAPIPGRASNSSVIQIFHKFSALFRLGQLSRNTVKADISLKIPTTHINTPSLNPSKSERGRGEEKAVSGWRTQHEGCMHRHINSSWEGGGG